MNQEKVVELSLAAGFECPEVSRYIHLIKRLVELVELEVKPKRAKKAKAAFDAVACLMENGVTEEAAQAWVANRKTPLTELAIKLTITQAEKAGFTLQMAVEEVVLRGWQGFKAEYVADRNRFCRTQPIKSNEWANELIGRSDERTIDAVAVGSSGRDLQATNRGLWAWGDQVEVGNAIPARTKI